MLKIEKNVAMPDKKAIMHDEYKLTAGKMMVGDSVLCADDKSAKKLGYHLRKLYGNGACKERKEKNGIRVWRARKPRVDAKTIKQESNDE